MGEKVRGYGYMASVTIWRAFPMSTSVLPAMMRASLLAARSSSASGSVAGLGEGNGEKNKEQKT